MKVLENMQMESRFGHDFETEEIEQLQDALQDTCTLLHSCLQSELNNFQIASPENIRRIV